MNGTTMRGRFVRTVMVAAAGMGAAMMVTTFATAGAPGSVERVSVASDGTEADDGSIGRTGVSGSGRFVAFSSAATNLVPQDANAVLDVFVHDRVKGTTSRVSVSSAGAEANGLSVTPALSDNGQFVAYRSAATNLVTGDANNTEDVFVHDRTAGTTSRVSVSSAGVEGDGPSFAPALSGNGKYVAYSSAATNLVPDDTNEATDVFVHDRSTGTTSRVSVSSTGTQGDYGTGYGPSISGTGRFVAFSSQASNLVPAPDTNDVADVFLHDRLTGTTTRVSQASDGSVGNDRSSIAKISANGRYVVFTSFASNLVPGDANNAEDVYLYDRITGSLERLNIYDDQYAQDQDIEIGVSRTGRLIAFSSSASSLVPDDDNDEYDVFVHDRNDGTTTLVSASESGVQGDDHSARPSISPNGKVVAFLSYATNLVPNDTNNVADVFVTTR